MKDDFLSIEVGATFLYEGRKYRKLDEKRATLLSDPESDTLEKGKAYIFYLEDEVQRIPD